MSARCESGVERPTVPFAIVAETWVEKGDGRYQVKYRYEGMLNGERTKAIIPEKSGRDRAEEIAEDFDGVRLEWGHFIP